VSSVNAKPPNSIGSVIAYSVSIRSKAICRSIAAGVARVSAAGAGIGLD